MIFISSMGDLFHSQVDFKWVDMVFNVIEQCPQHTFQILTKRPGNMLRYFKYLAQKIKDAGLDSIPSDSEDIIDYLSPFQNVWLGVTAENQHEIENRLPFLLHCPANVHYVSCEPLLGAINLQKYINKLDWVIVGGETGNKSRPMHPYWIHSIKKQCRESNTSFMFKQWGDWVVSNPKISSVGLKKHTWEDGRMMYKIGKNKAGREFFGKIYNEFPKK
jgi:protein gp37